MAARCLVREKRDEAMNAVEIYTNPGKYPRLSVLQHIIIRAAKALPEIEALALIRGAYVTDDGAFASLKEAKQIYAMIMADPHSSAAEVLKK
jgi:hypothetical protein